MAPIRPRRRRDQGARSPVGHFFNRSTGLYPMPSPADDAEGEKSTVSTRCLRPSTSFRTVAPFRSVASTAASSDQPSTCSTAIQLRSIRPTYIGTTTSCRSSRWTIAASTPWPRIPCRSIEHPYGYDIFQKKQDGAIKIILKPSAAQRSISQPHEVVWTKEVDRSRSQQQQVPACSGDGPVPDCGGRLPPLGSDGRSARGDHQRRQRFGGSWPSPMPAKAPIY